MTSHLSLRNVTAGKAPETIVDVSFTIGSGTSAFVGANTDGIATLFDVVTGACRVKRGEIDILGTSATLAAHAIARVAKDVTFPTGARVIELLSAASRARGDRAESPAARLERFDLSALSVRIVRTLSRAELRAVLLCEALTSDAVRLLAIEEPFCDVDPRMAARLHDAIRNLAARGTCIVVTSASPRDAWTLADTRFVLDRGRCIPLAGIGDQALLSADGARLRIIVDNPGLLLRALAHIVDVDERDALRIETAGNAVILFGMSLTDLATITNRAIAESDATPIEIAELSRSAPEIQGSIAGAYAKAYHAASTQVAPQEPQPPTSAQVPEPPQATDGAA